jgi:hypothetical protein
MCIAKTEASAQIADRVVIAGGNRIRVGRTVESLTTKQGKRGRSGIEPACQLSPAHRF